MHEVGEDICKDEMEDPVKDGIGEREGLQLQVRTPAAPLLPPYLSCAATLHPPVNVHEESFDEHVHRRLPQEDGQAPLAHSDEEVEAEETPQVSPNNPDVLLDVVELGSPVVMGTHVQRCDAVDHDRIQRQKLGVERLNPSETVEESRIQARAVLRPQVDGVDVVAQGKHNTDDGSEADERARVEL
eukprot:752845-Hanusia_phi.AAC.1